ncbi:MAG: hypothetical protein ACPG7F_13395, partial [Aggregatilineales bacterium]
MQRRLTLILILLSTIVLPVFAQDDEPTPNFFATATALIAGATQTAEAGESGAAENIDPFQLTATQLIANITLTAESSNEIGATNTPDSFLETATVTGGGGGGKG